MKKRMIIVIVCAFLALSALSSCSAFESSGKYRTEVCTALDALIDNDFDAFYETLAASYIEKGEAQSLFPQMREYLNGATTYELSLYYVSSKFENGVSVLEEQYFIQTDAGNFFILTTTLKDTQGFISYRIAKESEAGATTTPIFTGTVTTMQGASVAQWCVLLLGGLEILFLAYTVIDCARHEMKKKPLQLLIILLGCVSLIFFISSGGFQTNINYALIFSYTSFVIYSNNAIKITLFIPIGCIYYWCNRKKLLGEKNGAGETAGEILPEDYTPATENSNDNNFNKF